MAKRKRTIVLGIIGTLLLVVAAAGMIRWFYLSYGQSISTDSIVVRYSYYEVGKVDITGTTTSSSLAFSGFDYSSVENHAYMKLRYVPVNGKFTSGDLKVTTNNLNGIDEVYIQGPTKDDLMLVWSRDDEP